MSVNPSHLRPGNWIHRKGSSAYGIVNGKLLALLEEDEKERERFEYIELTPELLEAIGLKKTAGTSWIGGIECPAFELPVGFFSELMQDSTDRSLFNFQYKYACGESNEEQNLCSIHTIDQLQNLIFAFTGSELPLPESAKIINQAVEK